MFSLQKLLTLFGLFIINSVLSAQNPDILWQKTLTKDIASIKSLAIAEGKYVAALKGDEIVILDYNTGDSIRSFGKSSSNAAPYIMLSDTIFLGNHGDRLYAFITGGGLTSTYYNDVSLRSWDIKTGVMYKDIPMGSSNFTGIFVYIPTYLGIGQFKVSSSLDGKFIAITSFSQWDYLSGFGTTCSVSGASIRLFNTDDSIMVYKDYGPTSSSTFYATTKGRWYPNYENGKAGDVHISHSGNYILNNVYSSGYCSGEGNYQGAIISGGLVSLSPRFPSYKYNNFIKKYLFSYNEDFLMFGNQLYDFPPTRPIRTFSKTGSVFLPDDNHMLAFKQAGSVAAISNIEKDTWEKIYKGDSLIENTIQVNASRTAFATATNNRITLWKIPAELQPANLTADFSVQKLAFEIGDTIVCSNKTYPFKRGNYYFWNFGDGSEISREIHPSHIFKIPGTYNVTLEVWDTLGRVSTITKEVVVSVLRIPANALWINRSTGQPINSVRFSQDGSLLVSGSNDGNTKLWNSQNGNLLNAVNIKTPISSTFFMNDGKSIAISQLLYRESYDGLFPSDESFIDRYENNLYLWNFTENSLSNRYSILPGLVGNTEGPPKYISIKNYSSVSDLSGDNQTLLCGHRLTIDWCKVTPNTKTTPGFYSLAHYGEPRGNLVYYNFGNGKIHYQTPSVSSSIPDPIFAAVHALQICPNNRDYISIIEHEKSKPILLLRNIATDIISRQIPVTAKSMRFSPDKIHVLTNTGLWNIYDSVLVKSVNLPSIFEYHPDGIHVFTIKEDSTIGIYNLNTNEYEYFYFKQHAAFTALAVASDGKHIATGDKNGYVTVWNVPELLKTSIVTDFSTTLLNRSNLKTTDTVAFINTTLPVNNTFDFLWEFGDGTTSTERAPKHRYTSSGTYTIKLSVWQKEKMIGNIRKQSYISVIRPLSTEEPKAGLEPSFSILPNPSYGETTLSYTLSQPADIQIKITDVLGREISSWSLQEQAGEHSLFWNSASADAGMYYCMFRTGSIVRTIPFVVMQ